MTLAGCGIKWSHIYPWVTFKRLDDGWGVTANASDRVTEIELEEDPLADPLSHELGLTFQLEVMDVHVNQLPGGIPVEFPGQP